MAELVERPGAIATSETEPERFRGWSAFASRSAIRGRVNVRSWSAVHQFVLVLSLLYLVKQVIFVLAFPAFTGHDEVAHYAQIRFIATEGRLPVVPDLAEWRSEFKLDPNATTEDRIPDELYRYCRYVTKDWWNLGCNNPTYLANPPEAINFADSSYPSGWIYTANHPPLYYALMLPIYWLTESASPETQLYIFRFAAIPFGLVTVILSFLSVRALFPKDHFLAVVVPTFVAFQIQVSYEAAMLNNDIVGIATYSLVLYLMILAIRDVFPRRLCIYLGIALGIALLTKGTALPAVVLIGVSALVRLNLKELRGLAWRALAIGVPLVLLVAPWYAYLYSTYGNFSALDQIKDLQYWNYQEGTPRGFFDMLFDIQFAEDRFMETWGWFGWRLIPLSSVLLWAIGLPMLVSLIGFGLYAVTVLRGRGGLANDSVERPETWQKLAILMMLIACIGAYLAIIQFGTEFELTQARYYFPVVNAVAILLGLGLRSLIPMRFHPYGQGAVLGSMILLNTVIFTQYVIPYWQFNP